MVGCSSCAIDSGWHPCCMVKDESRESKQRTARKPKKGWGRGTRPGVWADVYVVGIRSAVQAGASGCEGRSGREMEMICEGASERG